MNVVSSSRTPFDFDDLCSRAEELELELADPDIWLDSSRANKLAAEKAQLDRVSNDLLNITHSLDDAGALLQLAFEENDQETLDVLALDLDRDESKLEDLEFQRMFSGELDAKNTYLDIQFGEGGTESQDWANMLFRMYIQWSESRGFQSKVLEISPGEIAGIRSATLLISGEYAHGWLRTESGVHRLVRHSPFKSSNRRHTSFASVFVYAEVDEDITIEIDPADVRTDTYRASGAGGQHVNRTDSAVRLTHLPTGTVVQCQSERSQHQNRAQAWRQLRAKLYSRALEERNSIKQAAEDAKPRIGFGSQIRSYVLDQSRVKDLRCGIEHPEPTRVLNGDIDRFLKANLKAGI